MTRLCSPVIRARGKLRADCEEQDRKRPARASVADNVGELGNAEQEAGELPTEGATGSDMFAQSYGGRETRASKFRVEQAVAANAGVKCLRKQSTIGDFRRGQSAEQQDDSSSGDDDGDLASEQYPESSGDDCEGLSSSERAFAAAVEAYGRLEDFEGDAAEFPGQTGDVGACGETILCGKCRDPESTKPCLVCDECDRSFHVSCLKIRPKTAEGYDEWLCDLCGSAKARQRRPLGKVALNARYSRNRLIGSEDRMPSQQGSSHENEKMLKPRINAVEDDKIEGRAPKVGEVSKPSVLVDCKMAIDVKSEKVEELADGDGSDQFLERLWSTSDSHCDDKVNVKPDENNGVTMKVEPGLNPCSTHFCVRSAQNLGSQEDKPGTGETGLTESGGIGSDLSGDLPQVDKVWDGRRQNNDAQDSRAVYALEQLKTFVAENCGMVSLAGWTATVKDRAKEGRIGSVRTYFFSPEKKRFSSKQEVFRYFESLANVSKPTGEEHGSSTGRVKTRSGSGEASMPSSENAVEEQLNSREGQEFQDTIVEKEAIASQPLRSDNDGSSCMASGTKQHMQFSRILGSPATSPLPPAYSGGGSMALDLSKDDPTELQVGDVLGPAQSTEPVIELADKCKMKEREVDAILQLQRYVAERNGFLGEGWTADITSRPKRGSVVCDVKYYSPDRKVLRSRAEVLRYLSLQDLKIEGLAAQEQSIKTVCAAPSDESHLMDVDKATVLQQLKSFISEKHGTLEEGWNVEVKRRTGGNATDKIYVSPGKQKFRSRLEVARFLGLDSSKTRNQGPFQKSNLQLPIRSGELNIVSLGEVDKWTGGDGSIICPVGYRSTWHDVHTGSFCISEVVDSDHAGPVFRVTRRSCSIFLGRQDGFGDCSGVQEHTAGWAGVSSDLKDEMGEFAVQASTSTEAWKAFAERCAEWWRARSQTHILPTSARKLALTHADWTVESVNGHDILVLAEDSCSEDETDGQRGCLNHLAGGKASEKMLSESVERMGQDRFGLTDEVVQTALKLHSRASTQDESNSQEGKDIGDSGEPSSKQQSVLKQGGTAGQVEEPGQVEETGQAEEAGEVVLDSPVHAQSRTLPVGVTFGAKLPDHLAGDVLEIWEFLCRFADVIGIHLPSFDDFEDGLVEQWEPSSEGATGDAEDGKHGLVSSAQCVEQTMSEDVEVRKELGGETAQSSVNQPKGPDQVASRGITALANIHIPLIKLLISDMKQKILGIQSMDAEELKLRQGKKRTFEDELLFDVERESCLPMNLITWPDVAHRYILALLALKREDEDLERRHQHYSRIFRLLQGDGGVLYGGLDGMAGAEADAQLLGGVEKELLTRMSPSDVTSVTSPVDPRVAGCLTEDNSIKSMVEEVGHLQKGEEKELWVQILEPVAQIPTNTGARIRNRVQESLKEGPPEWARKVLEWSITKDIFKGNAAGPTKHAVLSVLAKVRGEEVKPRKCRVRARKIVPSPGLITQRCRLVLREVAAADTSRVFCFLYGNGVFDANELEGDGSLKTTSGVVRPLDLRTIDLRLEAGVYTHSPEAFAADVRQIWKNAEAVYKDGSKMLRLSQKLSELFDELYEKQVTSLLQAGSGSKKRKDLPAQPLALEAVKSGKKSAASSEKPGLFVKDQGYQYKESPEKAGGGELLKAPWDEESCRICGVDDDYDNVLLCDGCEAEYHTYCLKPPLTKVPEGKWFCPHCLALEKSFPERLLEDSDAIEDQKTAEYRQNSVFDKSPLRALAERMEGREYWQLSTAEMVFLLGTLCDEALDTSIVRSNLDKSLDQSLELQQKLRLLVAERSQPRNVRIKKKALDEGRAVAVTQETPPARVQTRAERFERRFRLDEIQRGDLEYKPKSSSTRDDEAVLKGNQNDQVIDVVLKRKRGRPPKVKNSEGDTLTRSPGVVPKRRGRPPKATIAVEKRRGRPPKRKFESKEEVPAKRRGRPPRKVSEAQPSGQVDLESEAPVVSGSRRRSPELDQKHTAAEIREWPHQELAPGAQHMGQEAILLPSSVLFSSENKMVLEHLGSDKEGVCAEDKARLEAKAPDPVDAKMHVRGEELPANNTGISTCGVGCIENENVGPLSLTLKNSKPAKETAKSDPPIDGLESDGELSVDSAEEESNKRLDLEIERLEFEVMNMSLRREFLGRDNLGRQYWIVCGPGRRPQVAVEEQNMPYKEEGLSHTGSSYVENLMGRSDKVRNCERISHWMLYETESQVDELIACLRYSKQERALRSSLSQWRKSLVVGRSGTELHPEVTGGRQEEKLLGRGLSLSMMSIREEGNKVFFKGFPVLRATRILERRFGPFRTFESLADGKIKGKMKRVEPMYRCGCLEPVWAGRPHCKLCHETFVDEGELMRHKCQYPGQPMRIRKTKTQPTTSPLKSMLVGEPSSRKRKKSGYLSEQYFSSQFPDNLPQGDLHRVTKLKVRKRQSAIKLSGERKEGMATGADFSHEEPYGVSPEFQGTSSTPCDISGFRSGETGDGGLLEMGGFADGNLGNYCVQGHGEDSSLFGSADKSANSRRSARRKGVPLAAEQVENVSSAQKHSSRENLIHEIKLLSEDLRPDASQDINADPSSSTNSLGFVTPSTWGPHFNASCMSFSTAESTRERVLQIGCIADKGPTFAPALSFAPAFDPSLMMQSRSEDTFTMFPIGCNGSELLTHQLSFETDTALVNSKVSSESFDTSLLHSCNSEDPLYHGQDEDDDGGCLSASIIDFFATPNVDEQGWTMEDHGRFAIDDGVVPITMRYEHVKHSVLPGARDRSTAALATDGLKMDNICNLKDQPEHVELVCASVEAKGAGNEAMNVGSQDVYVPELDGHACTMEVTEQKVTPVECPGINIVEYEPPNSIDNVTLFEIAPAAVCTNFRSSDETKSPDDVLEPVHLMERNECQPVISVEGSLVCAAVQETPCKTTVPDRVQQTAAETPHAELHAEVEAQPTHCGFALLGEEDSALEKTGSGTAAIDGPSPELKARLNIPEASLRPLEGKHLLLLKWLKMNLLDVEAALTPSMLEPARAEGSRRRAWRSLVKSAKSLFEVTQALFVLELMIKSEFLRSSWGHWFSLSAILKTANISSVALRLFTLDTATSYEVGSIQPKKRGRKKKVRAEENDDVSD